MSKHLTRTELEKLIDENIIGYKAERNRNILKRRLCDGLTYDKLAEECDMSVRQVKKIVSDNKMIIAEQIGAKDK